MQILVNANIYNGIDPPFSGSIAFDKRITALQKGRIESTENDCVLDLEGKTVIPGLVDVHTHGRSGHDFNFATREEMKKMAVSYLASGVTSLMPTLASAPFSELCRAAETVRALASSEKDSADGAAFLGVHLEGRYLNPEKRGAHALSLLKEPNVTELEAFFEASGRPVHVTFAPELDREGSFLQTALASGATVGIGHTNATYQEALSALSKGAVSFTHTFNAMPPLHHREGGAVSAALLSDAYAEVIADGMHLSPETVALAARMKGRDRLVLITDSMEATGCRDGEYEIAGQKCMVKDGKALTLDGHLAGSTLTLLDGLANLMSFASLSLSEALPAVTRNPAAMVGCESDIGTLAIGKYADLLVIDEDDLSDIKQAHRPIAVWHRGKCYENRKGDR